VSRPETQAPRTPSSLTETPAGFRPRANNPGAGRRQGTPNGPQGAAPPSAGRAPGAARAEKTVVLTETTLGNGYLGSRIDEERSEMRYLV
jgi:hypothetical protein